MRLAFCLALAVLLSGCATGATDRSLPFGPFPNHYSHVTRLHLQVDGNGDFFPDNWHAHGKEASIRAANGLALSSLPSTASALDSYRRAALDEVATATQGKSRVFIFVHGYNNNLAEALGGYAVLEQGIVFEPGDVVIALHWDGLVDQGSGINAGRIWFASVANSQVVGSRALRPILNSLHNKRIILITHSRGASVVLSAISNPSYSARFVTDTEKLFGPAFLTPPPLQINNNVIDAVMLAPAIGNPDFWDVTCSGKKGCDEFRTFPGLRSLRYSQNPTDPALNKGPGLSILACNFNATTLGRDNQCGDWVRDHYNAQSTWMTAYPVEGLSRHSFPCYAGHPVLRRMLADVGVKTRGEIDGPLPPEACSGK